MNFIFVVEQLGRSYYGLRMKLICDRIGLSINGDDWSAGPELVRILRAEGLHVSVAPSADSLRFLTEDAWISLGCTICSAENASFEIGGADAELAAERILAAVHVQDIKDRTVLVTAGPTAEDIDCVRFLTNRSTGRMGIAVALAAARRGAEVNLVHGPLATRVPANDLITATPVRSATEMHAATMHLIGGCDIAIFAAAVADFTPANQVSGKIKKSGQRAGLNLDLKRTPDILAEAGRLSAKPFLVGFAAEVDDLEANAMMKIQTKNCDMICANIVSSAGQGFASAQNEMTIFHRDGRSLHIPLSSKLDCAHAILDEIIRSI